MVLKHLQEQKENEIVHTHSSLIQGEISYELVSRFGLRSLSARWFERPKGSSISVFVRLMIISAVVFFFGNFSCWAIEDFFVTTGSVRQESGVIRSENELIGKNKEENEDFSY